ncbi:MAG: methyl-coenzyme M reductase operon protein D [Methanobacterium sp.]|uniref:methyl-coenzyme M reductase operon protein D n=1 Tax=Methanobacterium sp. TaxID=2164 RepID=UPI003D64C89C|nr:methyl-coenzyme M reductase operon protein D [Methanobacterium sp.]
MDIEIFPHRLLNVDTAEKLLNSLDSIQGIKKMVIHGPRLPPVREGHSDRRTMVVNGEEVNVQVKPGRILLDIESEDIIDNIKEICEDDLPFGFNIHIGHFIRKQKTVTDQLKYGEELDEIPEEMVGLTDQNAKLSERAQILNRKKEE